MFKQSLKQKFFFLAVKFPAATILVIAMTLTCLLIITYSSYTNVYTKRSAVIDYRKDNVKTFIELYVNKKDIGQAAINNDVLWYLGQEGQRYKAPIVEIKDIPEKNSFYLHIEPVQEEIQKEFKNKPTGVYSVTVEILAGKEKIIKKLFEGNREAAR
ncbi:MAG: hypothetical protein N3I35_13870 [Clostridia bacterium]|nr:hypothetical protein [Clostridia bacterium]